MGGVLEMVTAFAVQIKKGIFFNIYCEIFPSVFYLSPGKT
jgi:hypothetical protein